MTQSELQDYRSYLFGVAYRILGCVADAQDAVQETYVRVMKAETRTITRSYLATIVTRICLDVLKSAHRTREEYVGPWIAEPIVTTDAPLDLVMQRESIGLGFLFLLEELKPVERAVYVLREVFELDFSDIGEAVEKSEVHCRKILSRCRTKLSEGSKPTSLPAEALPIVSSLLMAVQTRDQDAILSILASDAQWVSDGGGFVSAATRPILGAERVTKFVLGITRRDVEGLRFEMTEINGEAALLFLLNDEPFAIWVFSVRAGKVQRVWALQNPQKLAALDR